MEKPNRRVAVLIDAENVSASNAKQIFDTMSTYGEVTIKQIFADWSGATVKAWREEIANYSIVTYHQFSYVNGKNSSDLSLVIQAMVILFEKDVDIFCIVSSDSDFTRLAQELRERNKLVIGMGGRKNSSKSFINAFSEFIYLGEETLPALTELNVKPETLNGTETYEIKNHPPLKKPSPQKAIAKSILEPEKLETMREIVERLTEEYGRAFYSQISTEMKNKYSDFVPKNYNCKSMKYLMEKLLPVLRHYEVFEEPLSSNPSSKIMSLVKKKKEEIKK